MKKIQKSVIVTFAVLLAILSIGSFFSGSSSFSTFENRKLSSKPIFTVESFLKGQYGINYEKFMLDNFPGRNIFLKGFQAYTGLFYVDAFPQREDVLMGVKDDNIVSVSQGEKINESNSSSMEQKSSGMQKPIVEQDNIKVTSNLIMAGDRVMMPSGAYRHKEYGTLLAEIAKAVPSVKLYSITGPTSAAFYASDKYRTGGYDQSRAERDIESTAEGVTVVKAYDELLKHSNENIYFRSDIHWSALGAYYAYKAFCQSTGLQAASIEDDFTMSSYEPFLGGLYGQIYKMPQGARLKSNPEKLNYYIPKIRYKMTIITDVINKKGDQVDCIINKSFSKLGGYKYSCFTWGDMPLVKIETDNRKGRKVLIIKDSFGSAFTPFLTANYSEVYSIDPRGLNCEGAQRFDAKTLIREEKIDDVILCFAIYGGSRQKITSGLTRLLLK